MVDLNVNPPTAQPNPTIELPQLRRRPPASLRVRLSTRPELRRAVPTRLAVAFAEHRAQATWEQSPQVRQQALAAIDAIVAGTERAGETRELARRHVIEAQIHDAIFWRPWQRPAVDRESQANLRAAMVSERGVILSRCHLGPIFLGAGAITALGFTPYSTAGPWIFQTPPEGAWARRIDRWRRGVEAMGERLIYSSGSYETIARLLSQGELVQIYFDMPGSQRTDFLGKPVMLASGTARLAEQTGALVVPMHLQRDGAHFSAHLGAALDPAMHAGREALQEALAAAHGRSILRTPEALEDPNRAGAWEHGASGHAWVRPPTAGGAPAPQYLASRGKQAH